MENLCKMYFVNISSVIKKHLCIGCGFCFSICPENAIKHFDKPDGSFSVRIEEKKCTKCRKCVRICPSVAIPFQNLNNSFNMSNKRNRVLGPFINCLLTHSARPNIQISRSSGGTVFEIIDLLLNQKIVNGVVTVRKEGKLGINYKESIIRDPHQVESIANSVYRIIPIGKALKDTKLSDKLLFIGLPCQIAALRKWMKLNKKIQEKIFLTIGLFCNHAPNHYANKYIFQKLKISQSDIFGLSYRGMGWPGMMTINTKSKNYHIPLNSYWESGFGIFFKPWRCILCSDPLAELADLSIGDAWFYPHQKSRGGENLVITRSTIGERLINCEKMREKLEITMLNSNKVSMELMSIFNTKKRRHSALKMLNRIIFQTHPSIATTHINSSFKDYFAILKEIKNKVYSSLIVLYLKKKRSL